MNNSFGKIPSKPKLKQETVTNNEYYFQSAKVTEKKVVDSATLKAKKEQDIIKKYGIQKIVPVSKNGS